MASVVTAESKWQKKPMKLGVCACEGLMMRQPEKLWIQLSIGRKEHHHGVVQIWALVMGEPDLSAFSP